MSEWSANRRLSFKQTMHLIKADMQFRARYEKKEFKLAQVIKFLFNNAAVATVIYRFQIYVYQLGLTWLAWFLKSINSIVFSVSIDSKTQIEAGLFLMHANYICIGEGVKIGKNCIVAHQNSIAASPFVADINVQHSYQSNGAPCLGDDVIIGGGATISGAITLGHRTQISLNAAVEDSFPDGAVLFGVPAKNKAKVAVEMGAE